MKALHLNVKYQVVVLGGLMIVALLGTYTVPLIVGALVDGLGMDVVYAAGLGSVEIFIVAVTALCLSGVSQLPNGRCLAVIAMCLCAAGQLLSSISTDFYWLCLFRAMVGVGGGILLALVNFIIARSSSPQVVYGWVFTVSSCGFAIILALLPYTLEYNLQAGLFIALAVICLLGFPLITTIPSLFTESAMPVVEADGPDARSGSLVSTTVLVMFFLTLTIVYLAMGGLWSVAERVATGLALDQRTTGLLLGASTIAGIVGASSAAMLAARVGLMRPLLVGFMLSGVAVLLVAQASSVVAYSIGILLYGFCYMFTITFVLGVAAALDPRGKIAVAASGYLLIPYSLGPTCFGLIGLDNGAFLGWGSLALCLLGVVLIIPACLGAESAQNP